MKVYLSQVVHIYGYKWDEPHTVGVFATEDAAKAAAQKLVDDEYPLGGKYKAAVTEFTVQE